MHQIKSNALIRRAAEGHDLTALIAALEELESWQARPRKRTGRSRSASDFLAGYQLAAIYDLIFGPATDAKRADFIEAVLTELKLSRARDTILTAMRHYADLRKKLPWDEAPSLEHVDMPEIVRKALSGKK
jgi:hypothetical protein